MKNYLFTSVLLWITLSAFSQSAMEGHVYFLNSKYETGERIPAKGVYVEATGSNGDYSKSDGKYLIRFSHLQPGKVVTLSVGEKDEYIIDQENRKLEWVNDKDMETQTIPENPKDNPTNIIVCPKGYRDQIAQQYYNIIKTSTEIALAKKEKEYEELRAAQKKDWERINKLTNELAQLQKQADSLTIYKEAMQMASINKDDASKRVLKYLELLEEGKSIQEAREVLSIEDAADELKKSTSQFKAAIEELETRASASEAIFDYQDAKLCYETIISSQEKLNIDRLDLAESYNNIGRTQNKLGQYDKALKYLHKSIEIREHALDSLHPDLATSYNNIARSYLMLKQHNKALEYLENALEIDENAFMYFGDYQRANHYNLIGGTYFDLQLYNKAMSYYNRSKDILENFSDPDPAIYTNIGITFNHLGKHKKALEYLKKALIISEDELPQGHPHLADAYNNLGEIYFVLRNYNKALDYFIKSIEIREKLIDFFHPDLANSYQNIYWTYFLLGKKDKALEYSKKYADLTTE